MVSIHFYQIFKNFFLIIFILFAFGFQQVSFAQEIRLYGTGTLNGGSIFAINPDGTAPEKIVNFATTGNPGENELVEHDGKLWGMAREGGDYGYGVIFYIHNDGSNYTEVHHFNFTNGSSPVGSLLLYDNEFWGVTMMGGTRLGTIFKMSTTGNHFETVFEFNGENGNSPTGGLIEYNDTLFGLTSLGGPEGDGVIYSFDPITQTQSILHVFNGVNGNRPFGKLLVVDEKLWGITLTDDSYGKIFSIGIDGNDFSVIHNFLIAGPSPLGGLAIANGKVWGTVRKLDADGDFIYNINPDGSGFKYVSSAGGSAYGRLLPINDELWGTTSRDGLNGYGTIFRIKNDESEFLKEHDFQYSEGAYSQSPLTYSESTNRIWGMTKGGGSGRGIIFSINTDGTGYRVEHEFDGTKGFNPKGTLLQIDNFLYGTTSYGGKYPSGNNYTSALSELGVGTLYRVDIYGENFEVLHNFSVEDGTSPMGKLVYFNDRIWGVTTWGGANGQGTVYAINTDGTDFEKIRDDDPTLNPYYFENGGLEVINNKLWGTTLTGGTEDDGAIFTISPDGTEFNVIHNFYYGDDGGGPSGNLLFHDGAIYGTLLRGKTSSNSGSIFKMDDDGSNLSDATLFWDYGGYISDLINYNNEIWGMKYNIEGKIFRFDPATSTYTEVYRFGLWNAGIRPMGDLNNINDKLYGTTREGGTASYGVIYTVDTTGYTKIYDFTGSLAGWPESALTPVSITKTEPSMTFELSDKTYGDEAFALEATSNSEGSIEYSSSDSDIVSIDGSTATIKSAGQTTITATVNPYKEYSSRSIQKTMTISKAALLASAEDQEINFGEEIPTLTIIYDGFVNNDTQADIVEPKAETVATSGSTPGEYPITISGGESTKYEFTYADGVLTIVGVLGLDMDTVLPMNAYPNPVNDSFRIPNDIVPEEVQVYDLSGTLVKHFESAKYEYNINDLSSGTYILLVKTQENSYFNKLIKE